QAKCLIVISLNFTEETSMSTKLEWLQNQHDSQAQAIKKIGHPSSRFISRNVIINLPKQKELSVEVDVQQNEKNKLLGSAISYLETAKLIKLGKSADVEESKELKFPTSKKISEPINKTNDLDKVISKEKINGKNIESLAIGLSIVLLEKEIKKYLKNSLGISDVPDEVSKHIIFILLPEIIKLENENITHKEMCKIFGI